MRREIFARLAASLDERQLVALVTVLEAEGRGGQLLVWPGGDTSGSLGAAALDGAATALATELLPTFRSERRTLEHGGRRVEIFIQVHPPPETLVVIGAVHVSIPLVQFARSMGFRTVVIDPRGAFATPERFAHADELRVEWPQEALPVIGLHESSYLATLTHDAKIDLPALQAALDSPARYIGALGSRRTHAKRVAALEEAGYSAEQIARIHSPIGLPLGGRRAEEIALSVMAEVVAARHGKA